MYIHHKAVLLEFIILYGIILSAMDLFIVEEFITFKTLIFLLRTFNNNVEGFYN